MNQSESIKAAWIVGGATILAAVIGAVVLLISSSPGRSIAFVEAEPSQDSSTQQPDPYSYLPSRLEDFIDRYLALPSRMDRYRYGQMAIGGYVYFHGLAKSVRQEDGFAIIEVQSIIHPGISVYTSMPDQYLSEMQTLVGHRVLAEGAITSVETGKIEIQGGNVGISS